MHDVPWRSLDDEYSFVCDGAARAAYADSGSDRRACSASPACRCHSSEVVQAALCGLYLVVLVLVVLWMSTCVRCMCRLSYDLRCPSSARGARVV
eukprot:1993879-Prymnesium_polylepis.1